MKKKGSILLLILLLTTSLYASVQSIYIPYRLRSEAMGGTSISSALSDDILYANPALINADEAYISIPSLSISLFNFNRLIEKGGPLYMLLAKEDWSNETLLSGLINSIMPGEGDLASVNLSMSLISGIMGMSFDTTLDLHTSGRGSENSTVIAEANVAAALGLGIPIEMGPVKVSFGLMGRLNFRFYTVDSLTSDKVGGFSASTINSMLNDEDIAYTLLNATPVSAGISFPLDFGMAIYFPFGFKAGAVWRGLNGSFAMQNWNGVNQLYNSLTGGYIDQMPSDIEMGSRFKFSTPSSFDIGLSWRAEENWFTSYIMPSVAVDLVDLMSLFNNLTVESLVYHTRLGAELKFMNILSLQAGLNQGYLSLGVDFNLQIFRIGVVYATHEYGESLGETPLDSLSIRFLLGYGH